MTYAAGEALILTQIQAITKYTTANTSRGNYKPLNRGKSDTYAILRPGPFTRKASGMGGQYTSDWVTICEVWQRYKLDGDTLTNLEARRQEIIDRFDANRKAADTTGKIVDVFVRSGGDILEMWKKGGNGPAWFMQELTIEWLEEESVNLQE